MKTFLELKKEIAKAQYRCSVGKLDDQIIMDYYCCVIKLKSIFENKGIDGYSINVYGQTNKNIYKENKVYNASYTRIEFYKNEFYFPDRISQRVGKLIDDLPGVVVNFKIKDEKILFIVLEEITHLLNFKVIIRKIKDGYNIKMIMKENGIKSISEHFLSSK
jgi:hypothetical protein